MKPLCFVLMPFGEKKDENGRTIDFDEIYNKVIKPAVEDAELEPIRADEETIGGIIHKPMFERLMLCDYAVADLTTANPNVFYELGVRHGIRPHSTVLIFGKGGRLPFDVAPLRAIPYGIDANGSPETPNEDRKVIAGRLIESREPVDDSPLFQLVTDWPKPDLAHLKTDSFRELVNYSKKYKERLADARKSGVDALSAVEKELNLKDVDPAIIVDLYLSYRAVEAWQQMVDLVQKMPRELARTVMIREQLGFALNRLKRSDEAEKTLKEVIDEFGANSETNGLLGRVYKDRWDDARTGGRAIEAKGYLRKAITTYLNGFEADWRDAFPGINAVTLMEMDEVVDSRQSELLPVVRYAVKRRLSDKKPNYWDYATLLELSVLATDANGAEDALSDALASNPEKWQRKTTANNLRLIREAREKRNVDVNWIAALEDELNKA
jgi:tetratricopeptide (TPR) repeat protein